MGDSSNSREKGLPPPGAEVVAVNDSEVDSDTEFFTAKPIRRTAKKKAPPPRRLDSTPTRPRAVSHDVPSDSDDDSDAERRRKRRKAKARAKPPSLPDWTRPSRASQERGRSRTTERESSVAISLLSDEEPERPDKGKGRATATRRPRIELTPPPELAEEDRASIEEQSRRLLQGIGVVLEDDNDVVEVGSSSPDRDRSGPKVLISVQMVADPDKRAVPGSGPAVAAYEKKKIYHLFQTDPLSSVLQSMALRVQVPVEQLVLVHEGQRIFATDKTPKQLGISFTGELKVYEIQVYEKIQRAERRARLALFDDSPRPDRDADDAESSRRSPSPLRAPSPPAVRKVKLHLRGPKGELHFSAAPTTLVSTIVKYYCNKQGVDVSEVPRFRLEFDGEHFDGDSTVEDMEVESGDLIDVSYR